MRRRIGISMLSLALGFLLGDSLAGEPLAGHSMPPNVELLLLGDGATYFAAAKDFLKREPGGEQAALVASDLYLAAT